MPTYPLSIDGAEHAIMCVLLIDRVHWNTPLLPQIRPSLCKRSTSRPVSSLANYHRPPFGYLMLIDGPYVHLVVLYHLHINTKDQYNTIYFESVQLIAHQDP
jgi:hypothetical protein